MLSVHDSYIFDHMNLVDPRRVMADASEAVIGRTLPTSIKLPDVPEFSYASDEQVQDHIENRKGGRKVGYVKRMLRYKAETGRAIRPYQTELCGAKLPYVVRSSNFCHADQADLAFP